MKVENSNVLVTGGAGFIGSHLVDRLLEKQNHIVVVDDFSTGEYGNLVSARQSGRVHLEEATILDFERMQRACHDMDFIFHLATQNVRRSLRQPSIVHEVNTSGTLNMLKAAAGAGVKRFLYCSSSEVNGTADMVPMPEDYRFRPETIYGASKLAGEYYTQVFNRAGWLDTVIARPHNNYGPREHFSGFRGEVIPRFILWALAGLPLIIYGNGTQTRDFTYVKETAAYLVELLENDAAIGDTYNICRGREVSIREIAETIIELAGSSSVLENHPARPHDVLRLYGDTTHLRELLGKSPSVSIEEGLQETIAWFRANVELDEKTIGELDPQNWQSLEYESWLGSALSHTDA